LQAPVLSLDARLDSLRTPQASAEQAEFHLRELAPVSGADTDGGLPRRFTGQGDGRFTGLRIEATGLDLGPLLAQPVEWSFAGTVDLAAGAADLQLVEVTAGDLALFGAGTASEGFSQLAASLSLRAADLAALSPLAGLPPGMALSGAAAIDAEVVGSLDGSDLVATLGGSLDDLHTAVPTSDALLAGHVALGGKVTLRGGTLSAEGLRLAGPALRLTADGTAGETLDMSATAELPDLAVLSRAIAAPLDGSLRLAATVTGPAAAPRVHLDVDGRRLGAAGARLAALGGTVDVADALARPRLEAKLEGRDFALEAQSFDRIGLTLTASVAEAEPRGRVALELHRGAEVITAQTDFDRTAPSTLRLSGLAVRGPGVSLEGTVQLAGGVATGRVAGTVGDFAAFAGSGAPLSGRADFAMDLAGAQGRQRVTATADATGLALSRPDAEPLGIDSLHLEAGVEDAFGAPRIDVTVTASGVREAETTLRTASVTVRGPTEALAFSVQAEGETAGPGGEPPRPVSLATAGTLSTQRTRTSLEIGSLEARYAGQTLKLLHAATAAWGGGRMELHGLEAQAGQNGRLTAEAALGADSVSATVTVRALPLAMAAALSPGLDLSGTLDADMTVSGAPAQPEGRMRLHVAGVRSGALGDADMAAVDGTVEAVLQAGTLSAMATFDGPPGATFSASLQVPVVPVPSADGAMPAIPVPAPDAPLTGRIDGAIDLSLLPGIIDLAGDRLGGRAEARLAISGTVAAPDISGEVRLADASYESAELGTVVRHLDAEAEGDRGRIVLRSLSARDGEDGRLTATGSIDLAAGGTMPFRLDARFDDFLLLQRDDATVAADGTVAVARAAGGGTIDGALTVRSAELRIPEPQPPQIVKLDVVEIDAPPTLHRISPERAGPAGAAPAPAAAPWRLDVTIDLPGQVFVRGRGLDSEWRGQMAIRGTADAPDITGRLEAVRGSFSILERTLTLDRGVITFTGGATVDPTLDVASSTQVEGTKVELVVGGTLTDPKIEATSDTGLPQDEVLAMLLFGKRLGALTPAQAVQLASAAGTLTGGGPDVLDTIRRSVGLDFLGIQSAEGEAAGAGGDTIDASALRAGKYLTEDVFVHVDQGLTPESRRVGVEVRVLPETLPGVTVNSDVGADARSSVGVNWKYDY
ncbi:MAG: translocation/assembly module TamB domain-containing protein, partial [Rhodospirillaceae bacterium]|nr:translocation/assembly module TamB domain-containing protein [Rhodospirillaceae bacterium]